ncbi:hypothetical protein AB0L41_33685 [Amycolatopsis mediterranei]|uniref:hypothetical protein n=1 Tax=Amycolatopsis mediterranei TaxID=33910 RepID=UPI00341265D8
MAKFVRPALWTAGVLAAGGFVFWLLLALNIPYQSTAAPDTTPGTAPATTTVLPSGPPSEGTAYVTDVRPGPDDHSAVLHVNLPTCADAPHTQVTEADGRIDAGVRYRPRPDPDCKQASADFPFRTAAPIGERPVIVNDAESWGLVSGGWKRCDRYVGCHPPADHCDPAYVGQLEFSAEAEFPGTARACDQNWLVHDLQRHSGQAATRVAYRWAGSFWESFAGANGGGCAEILAVEPKFPTALCEHLGPPG